MTYDFCGYATKANLKCADGRVILKDAFKHDDGVTVPLVWQHQHNDPKNILGHAKLENRDDGVFAFCRFNETDNGKNAKELVKHGDIQKLSIYANELKQNGSQVVHGSIREVSLVIAGANPGASILNVMHSEDGYIDDEQAIIHSGETFSLEVETEDIQHAVAEDMTVKEMFESLTQDQRDFVVALVADAIESADSMQQSDENSEELKHEEILGGNEDMKKNVFEQSEVGAVKKEALTPQQVQAIFHSAISEKTSSLKATVMEHAGTYGIDNIEILFPDAHKLNNTPDFVSRRMEWVSTVLNGTRHTPFSRIKTVTADITADEARARGYVKGNEKFEEVFPVMSRVTTPQTIYKKQKLDRDDIIDVTDFDIVAWIKAEMRVMLDEEIARAVLIGDGRAVGSADKIKEDNIRPIYKDDAFYSYPVVVAADANAEAVIEAILRAKVDYRGSGSPTFFTTPKTHIDMLLVKDGMGRRLYNSDSELMSALGVSRIVEVELMDNVSRVVGADTRNLLGIVVNLNDYVIGADRGGAIATFDDFDIDFNQYKYLIETRISGALVRYKSAMIIEQAVAAG